MSLYFCGIPMRENGTYYCPLCGYESKDIEKFALGMCWKCVFPEPEKEEVVGVKSSDLKRGDRVRVTKEVTFGTRSNAGSGFYGTDGSYYWNSADTTVGKSGAYEVTLIEKAPPEEWPPKAGDVWRIDTGAEYACLNQYGIDTLYRTDGGSGILYAIELRKKNPVLVYRKGNKPCETKNQ